jgi:hypothetical protein
MNPAVSPANLICETAALPPKKTQRFCIFRFAFEPQQAADLGPLSLGQEVEIIRDVDENWYFGKSEDGRSGIFPKSFVEVFNPKSDEPIAVASRVHDGRMVTYDGGPAGLSFRKGEVIVITKYIDSEWFLGYRATDQRKNLGRFQRSYVEYGAVSRAMIDRLTLCHHQTSILLEQQKSHGNSSEKISHPLQGKPARSECLSERRSRPELRVETQRSPVTQCDHLKLGVGPGPESSPAPDTLPVYDFPVADTLLLDSQMAAPRAGGCCTIS